MTGSRGVHDRDADAPPQRPGHFIYRNGNEFNFASPSTQLAPGDEVVVLTRAAGLKELRKRFGSNKKLDVRVG